MTFVGKILVVVQLVLAVCFMAFAGAVYTAETTWRAKAEQADQQRQQAATDASNAAQEAQRLQTELTGQVEALNQRVALLDSQVKQSTDQLSRTEKELQEARTAVDRQTAVANLAEEQSKFRQEETLRQRERNERLQSQINELLAQVRKLEDQDFAKNLAIESMEGRQQAMIEKLADYRSILLSRGMSLDPKDYENLVAVEPPPTVTGQVLNTRVSDTSGVEFVEVSLGSDDGFEKGHELYLYRGDQYLGKVKLTNIYPDRAVGTVVQRVRNGTVQKGDNVTPKL